MHAAELIRWVLFALVAAWAIRIFRQVGRGMTGAQPPAPAPRTEPAGPTSESVVAALRRPAPPPPAPVRPRPAPAPVRPRPAPAPVRPQPVAPQPTSAPPVAALPFEIEVVVEPERVPMPRRRPLRGLRRAVVWSEILSPPLALRERGTLGRPPAL